MGGGWGVGVAMVGTEKACYNLKFAQKVLNASFVEVNFQKVKHR
jgi:hypothetical protein